MNAPQPLIIAISGKLGTGKDYIGNLFCTYLRKTGYNPMFLSFADHLKVEAMARHNLTFSEVTDKKTEKSRRILQLMGTEEYKAKYGDDVWVRYFNSWLQFHSARGINAFIVCDLRFTVEYEYLQSQKAFIVRLDAPDRNMIKLMSEFNNDMAKAQQAMNHASETNLDTVEFETVIDNRQTNFEFVAHFKLVVEKLNRHIAYLNASYLESVE